MPGDNVEMVCDLVHDVATEVGSRYVHPPAFQRRRLRWLSYRFTLREGGRTGKFPTVCHQVAEAYPFA